MPRTRSCEYCGADIEPGTGTMFVQVDGTTTHFCSAKCEKNADLGREPRDLEWTEAGQAAGGEAVPQLESDVEEEAPIAGHDAVEADPAVEEAVVEDEVAVDDGPEAIPDLAEAEAAVEAAVEEAAAVAEEVEVEEEPEIEEEAADEEEADTAEEAATEEELAPADEADSEDAAESEFEFAEPVATDVGEPADTDDAPAGDEAEAVVDEDEAEDAVDEDEAEEAVDEEESEA